MQEFFGVVHRNIIEAHRHRLCGSLRRPGKKALSTSSVHTAPALAEGDPRAPALMPLPRPSFCAELQRFTHYCSPQRKAVGGKVGPEGQKQPKVRNICLAAGNWKFEGFRSRCPNSWLEST